MNKKQRRQADVLYIVLTALFTAALIACNLIANRFNEVDLGFKIFRISAGVLPYPITFLITDILSEIYGKKKTNRVVISGFLASLFVLGILWLGSQFPPIAESPVSEETYDKVFGNSWRVILASMVAYLSAQLVDVQVFHFWKNLTKGKHLWLRNNASTIFSQWVDTTLVVMVLFLGNLPMETIWSYIVDGWLFKALCALIDTPIIYLVIWVIRKRFNLKVGQELNY